MPATNPTQALNPAAKKLVAEIETLLVAIEGDARSTDGAKVATEIRRDAKAQQRALAAALKTPGTKTEATLRALLKAVQALAASSDKRSSAAQDEALRSAAQARVSATMMQWMVLLAKIDDPALTKPLIAEQSLWRKRVDAVEKNSNDWAAFTDLQALEKALPGMLAKAVEAQGVAQWVRSIYRPAHGRVLVGLKGVVDERCRRNLVAEVAAIEQDRQRLLAGGRIAEAKKEALTRLGAVDKLVARIVATAPAIDRELDRIAGLLQKAGNPMALAESLRSLRTHKASGWPKGGSVDEMGREIAAFESALTRFAALATKEVAAAAKTPKLA